jgi:hypothetical protein
VSSTGRDPPALTLFGSSRNDGGRSLDSVNRETDLLTAPFSAEDELHGLACCSVYA